MIEKTIDFFYGDNNSEVFKLLHPQSLEKTAGVAEEILEFLKELLPQPDKTYALINALSSGEYYGSNRNGDYFPEDALAKYHKTFEALGHVYRHHVNKDPKKSIGKVIFSFYNPTMHRVELIVELENDKAKDVIDDFNSGKLPATSMGCKVPWDECSICGNRARVRPDYCDHLKKQMNMILAGGKKVYAVNREPKFFDISLVFIAAEKTSSVLNIFSNLIGKSNSEELKKVAFYSENTYTKVADFSNTAEISKKIDSISEGSIVSENPKELVNLILSGQQRLKDSTLQKLAEYPFNSVMSTFLALRAIPDPRDFQKLALYSQGFKQEADDYDSSNILFDLPAEPIIPTDIDYNNFNEKIANELFPELEKVLVTKEAVVTKRLIKLAEELPGINPNTPEQIGFPVPLNKDTDDRALWKQMIFDKDPKYQRTAHKNPILPLGILGGLYYGYAKIFSNPSTTGFRKFMLQNPWLLPVLIGAGTAGSLFMQDKSFNKTAAWNKLDMFAGNSLISFPLAYYAAATKENKAQSGVPLTGTEDFVRKHPALLALTGSIGATMLQKKFTKVATIINQLPIEDLNKIYIDLLCISGGKN